MSLGVELLDPMVILCVIEGDCLICPPWQHPHFTFPTSNAQQFWFLHISCQHLLFSLCVLLLLLLFDNNHPKGREVISHYDFDLQRGLII